MDSNNFKNKSYLDILFEGRNKKYGGYELRTMYPVRARRATIMTVAALLLLIAYPVIAGLLKGKGEPLPPPPKISEVALTEPPPIDEKEPPPPPPPSEPPPPVKPTVQFTPPVIAKDEEVKETERPPDVKELEDKAAGLTTQEGDPNGIDPGIIDNPGTGSGTGPIETPKQQVFTYVEQMPEFPGGEAKMMQFLSNNLNYPSAAREAGQEGRVIVKFVVNEDGTITGVQIVRGFGYGSEEEAKRVVSKMPNWTPGKQNGKAVKVEFSLPIRFKLDD